MDNARHVHRQTLKKKTLLTLALLLGGTATVPGSLAAAPAADRAPAELKMILSPGRNNAGAITFRTEGEGETAGQAAAENSAAAPGHDSPAVAAPAPAAAATGVSAATANRQTAAAQTEPSRPRTPAYPSSFTLGTGYRRDELSWNIADIDRKPNVLSELQYDDVESLALSANMRWSNSSNLYVRGGVNIGSTLSGDVQDSDYLGNNRTLEYSRSSADVDTGLLLGADIGVGYRFDMAVSGRDRSLHLMPLVGYSYSSQELDMTDGLQVIPAYGSFDGLDSSYDAHWSGPWIGLDMELAFNKRHALLASLEYHWVDYKADADWNLRSDFSHPVSFEHDANGDGAVASITYRYTPNAQWFWTVGYLYSRFEADNGNDATHFADGRVVNVPFNEAEWESHAVMIGLGFTF